MRVSGRPVTCAYPVAAWPTPCSWRTRMCRTEGESKSGSYSGRKAPFGMPNTTSTPSRSIAATRAAAPVMRVLAAAAGSLRGGPAALCRAASRTRARVGAWPFAGRGGPLLGPGRGTGRAGVGSAPHRVTRLVLLGSRGVGLGPFRAVPCQSGPRGAAVVWSVIASISSAVGSWWATKNPRRLQADEGSAQVADGLSQLLARLLSTSTELSDTGITLAQSRAAVKLTTHSSQLAR